MSVPPPHNSLTGPLLTDLYQLTMAVAHFNSGNYDVPCTFELFFRKPPFGGQICVFAG